MWAAYWLNLTWCFGYGKRACPMETLRCGAIGPRSSCLNHRSHFSQQMRRKPYMQLFLRHGRRVNAERQHLSCSYIGEIKPFFSTPPTPVHLQKFPKAATLAVVRNVMLFIRRWGYAKDKPQTPAVYGTWAEQSKQLTLQNKFPLLDLILDLIQLNHGTWLRRTRKEKLARNPLRCVYLGAHLKIYMVIFGMSFQTTYWHIMAWLRSESNQIWRGGFPITPDKPLPFPPSEGLIRQHVDLSFLSLAVFISLHRGMTSLWFAISLCLFLYFRVSPYLLVLFRKQMKAKRSVSSCSKSSLFIQTHWLGLYKLLPPLSQGIKGSFT